MYPELFEHFAIDNHNFFLNNCCITLIDKKDSSDPHKKTRLLQKGFENCSSLWAKYFKLTVTSARFYTFFQGRGLVNVNCILLKLTCVFFKDVSFCILGYPIILLGGDTYRLETNQLISIVSWLLGFYKVWDVSWRNFWTFCNFRWMFF